MSAALLSLIGAEEGPARSVRRLVVWAFLLGLCACSPVETFRDWTGASQNDPDPDTTPNTKNLAAGEAADYPNLATVPPPPVRGMTAAEREKLTQSLIADRANARYTNEQLRAGFSTSQAAPPPPPASSASEAHSTQPEPAGVSPTPLAPASVATGEPGPAQREAAPPPAITSSATARPGEKSNVSTRSARAGGKKPAEPGEGLRKQGEPPEPGPMESNLEIPQARATPQPEQVQPSPPRPLLPPTPKVANAPPSLPPGLAAGGVLARTPSAAPAGSAGFQPPPAPPELPPPAGSAGFQPPPAPPELPPPAPPRSAAAGEDKASGTAPAPVAAPVTEIKFGGDSTNLTDKDRQTLEAVLPVYQQNPGKIRIVGYASGGSGAVEKLNSYRTALDRAQAVAAALKQAGIPSDKIQVEAAPGGTNPEENRAAVLLEH
jgi:outer membrane protein OmpA-like peptidoglycan-associated protein